MMEVCVDFLEILVLLDGKNINLGVLHPLKVVQSAKVEIVMTVNHAQQEVIYSQIL